MPDKKGNSARKSGLNVDTALVRELADMLADTGLTEIEVEEGDMRVRVSRGGGVAAAPMTYAAPAAPAAPAPAADAAPAAEAPAAASAGASSADAIKSPMVGTAYLASDPESANFVALGDSVKKGDTLLIVEAMKVMNPITAEKDGTVKEILIDNGDPVEFGQPLVVVG